MDSKTENDKLTQAKNILPTIVLAGLIVLTVFASFHGCISPYGDPPLVSLTLSPSNPNIAPGATQQFAVTGTYADDSTKDLTSQVTWTSADPLVASINASGLAMGGDMPITARTTITASLDGVAGSTVLKVVNLPLVSIAVTPSSPGIAKGTTQQFMAAGTYSDGESSMTLDVTSLATWTSSNDAVASVDSSGFATSFDPGVATITASKGAVVSPSVSMAVKDVTLTSLSMTPTEWYTFFKGSLQFRANGTFSDGTIQDVTSVVAWSTEDPSIATITSSGLVTITRGLCQVTRIKATSGGVLSALSVSAWVGIVYRCGS